MSSWLINDCLTCIPGTETFWHDLLNWFPNLNDMCNVYTSFKNLPCYIEEQAKIHGEPDYIIRNASFFRPLNLKCKTISFLQDCYPSGHMRDLQIEVCNKSDVVVFNSPYTEAMYEKEISSEMHTIPIGTDFKFFRPLSNKSELCEKWEIPDNCILFVGSTNKVKNFKLIEKLINETNYNICLVMKDNFTINKPNVKIFNKVTHLELVEIINCCSFLICSSIRETFHLAGVEAIACDKPVLASNVGVYYNREDGDWGQKLQFEGIVDYINKMFNNINSFSPRECFLKEGLDKNSCKESWISLIERITNDQRRVQSF